VSGLSSDPPPDPSTGAESEQPSTAAEPGDGDGRRDGVGHRRDRAGDERDEVGDRRDRVGHRRDTAGDERDDAADRRDEVAEHRDEAGIERDEASLQRDTAGAQRDRAGERRDEAAERRDEAAQQSDSTHDAPTTADIIERSELSRRAAARDRTRASQDRQAGAAERTMARDDRRVAYADRRAGAGERAESHLDRDVAHADRRAGAGERAQSGADRDVALADRGASAVDRESSSHDALTGAYQRGTGFVELEREIVRARRDHQTLVVAFLDVDGLKAANDAHGHARGDRMLRAVVDALRSKLRAHDLVIRYGGDEFVCAVSGLSLADATERLTWVNHTLGRLSEPASVTVGLAELRDGESSEELVARADDALYAQRERHGGR
jgi:diguanylate cyclase (GGDEF)-like protein